MKLTCSTHECVFHESQPELHFCVCDLKNKESSSEKDLFLFFLMSTSISELYIDNQTDNDSSHSTAVQHK